MMLNVSSLSTPPPLLYRKETTDSSNKPNRVPELQGIPVGEAWIMGNVVY